MLEIFVFACLPHTLFLFLSINCFFLFHALYRKGWGATWLWATNEYAEGSLKKGRTDMGFLGSGRLSGHFCVGLEIMRGSFFTLGSVL